MASRVRDAGYGNAEALQGASDVLWLVTGHPGLTGVTLRRQRLAGGLLGFERL